MEGRELTCGEVDGRLGARRLDDGVRAGQHLLRHDCVERSEAAVRLDEGVNLLLVLLVWRTRCPSKAVRIAARGSAWGCPPFSAGPSRVPAGGGAVAVTAEGEGQVDVISGVGA